MEVVSMLRIKAEQRIQINNILSAVCVGVLGVLLASASTLSAWSVAQLLLALPCLVTSSLAYCKVCYRPQEVYELWNGLGWITHSVGYI